MGVLAIVVNCYLIAQCGQLQRLFPWLSPEGAIISVVVLEVRCSRWGFAPTARSVAVCYCRVSRCVTRCCLGSDSPSPPWMESLNPPLQPQAAPCRHWAMQGTPPECYCRVSLVSHPLRGEFREGAAVPTGVGWGCSAGPVCPTLQHFALFLKYIIQVAIPDIPAWVAEEMAKLEYQRREAFKVGDAGVGPSSGPSVEPGHPIPGAGGLPGVSPGCPRGVPRADGLPVDRSTSGRRSTTSSSSSGASGRRRSGSGTPSTKPARSGSPAATRPSPRPPGRTRPTRRARAKGKAPGVPRTAPTSPSDPAPSWPPTT